MTDPRASMVETRAPTTEARAPTSVARVPPTDPRAATIEARAPVRVARVLAQAPRPARTIALSNLMARCASDRLHRRNAHPPRLRNDVRQDLSAVRAESRAEEPHEGGSGPGHLLADRLRPGGVAAADREGKRSENLLRAGAGLSSQQQADQARGLRRARGR